MDEEYLLSQQTPQKQRHPDCGDKRQIASDKVMRWFICEHFYSQMDRGFFADTEFKSTLDRLGVLNTPLSTASWTLIRKAYLQQNSNRRPHLN